MFRVILGIIIPILITFAVWTLGRPPATSLFWTTAEATVSGHITFEEDNGYGPAEYNLPLVDLPNEETYRLSLDDFFERAAVEAAYPVGKTVAVKLSPSGTYAYRVDDARRNYMLQFGITAIALALMLIVLLTYFKVLGGTALFTGPIGLAFVALPLFLVIARWQIGDPPPLAHVTWPTKQATIIETRIDTEPVGNGTTRYLPIVLVQYDGSPETWVVEGYRGGFKRDAEATLSRVTRSETLKVNLDSDGKPYEARWRFQHYATAALTLFLPVLLVIGGLLLLVTFTRDKARTESA
ncbi:MAG: hypothetical protein AAGH90_04085 [Pseudomonadota bacterium]